MDAFENRLVKIGSTFNWGVFGVVVGGPTM